MSVGCKIITFQTNWGCKTKGRRWILLPTGGIQSVNHLLEYPYEILEMSADWSHDSMINLITPTCPRSSVQGLVLKSQDLETSRDWLLVSGGNNLRSARPTVWFLHSSGILCTGLWLVEVFWSLNGCRWPLRSRWIMGNLMLLVCCCDCCYFFHCRSQHFLCVLCVGLRGKPATCSRPIRLITADVSGLRTLCSAPLCVLVCVCVSEADGNKVWNLTVDSLLLAKLLTAPEPAER